MSSDMQYIQCLAQVALSKSDVSSCCTFVARRTIPKGGTHWTTGVNWIPGLGLCGKEKHLEGSTTHQKAGRKPAFQICGQCFQRLKQVERQLHVSHFSIKKEVKSHVTTE